MTDKRHTKLIETYGKEKASKEKANALFRARKEVSINGNGTSGYVVKNGPHKGKVLGHFSQKYRSCTEKWASSHKFFTPCATFECPR